MIFDPRCAPADPNLVDLVAFELSDAALTNSTIIDTDPYTFFGATRLRQDGSMSNRSDVWIIELRSEKRRHQAESNYSPWRLPLRRSCSGRRRLRYLHHHRAVTIQDWCHHWELAKLQSEETPGGSTRPRHELIPPPALPHAGERRPA